MLSKWHLFPFPSLHRLPISAAGGCDTWLGRRASPGWLENRWPLDPRSKQGRSNVRAQRAQPQGSEVKRQGLSERAAGWSAPLGIAEDCTCACMLCVGRGKGGRLSRIRTLSWLGMLWHCRNRKREEEREKCVNATGYIHFKSFQKDCQQLVGMGTDYQYIDMIN